MEEVCYSKWLNEDVVGRSLRGRVHSALDDLLILLWLRLLRLAIVTSHSSSTHLLTSPLCPGSTGMNTVLNGWVSEDSDLRARVREGGFSVRDRSEL